MNKNVTFLFIVKNISCGQFSSCHTSDENFEFFPNYGIRIQILKSAMDWVQFSTCIVSVSGFSTPNYLPMGSYSMTTIILSSYNYVKALLRGYKENSTEKNGLETNIAQGNAKGYISSQDHTVSTIFLFSTILSSTSTYTENFLYVAYRTIQVRTAAAIETHACVTWIKASHSSSISYSIS